MLVKLRVAEPRYRAVWECWRQHLRASLVTHSRRGSDLARRPVKSPAKEGSGCLVRLFLIPEMMPWACSTV